MIASIEDQQIIDTGSPHEERRITATIRVAAGNAGLTRFRLVCVALVFTLFYTVQLHGTATRYSNRRIGCLVGYCLN